MSLFYYDLALIIAAIGVTVAVAVYLRNRYQAVGPPFVTRALLLAVTLLAVVVISFVFIGITLLLFPKFMSSGQIGFTILLVAAIGLALTIGLPRLAPRAERTVQERLFGPRFAYQDALAGLVNELRGKPTMDEMMEAVVTAVHAQMRVSRVMIFMQDPVAGTYKREAGSGLNAQELENLAELPEHSPVIAHLQRTKNVLVRDELARSVPADASNKPAADLDRLKTSVCVPMILDEKLLGVLCLGEKANRDIFFASDLKLLETLATEVALAVNYRRMEEQMFRNNKLISLGTIAAGVAHEIRNPLASIKTFAQLMPHRMDDPEFKNEFSQLVVKDVDRITNVVETMLAFARPTQITIEENPVNDLVDEAATLMQSRLKSKHIQLTKSLHGNQVVKVDKQQILQVLVNLLNNAVDALSEQGKIRISTGVRPQEGASNGGPNGKYAVIAVTDDGHGVPAAMRDRLFDPFFTTKADGTGLGLSISQKIVRDHGGTITVTSTEGKGSTFQVNLPVS
jgi:signal transduction histidine kinase